MVRLWYVDAPGSENRAQKLSAISSGVIFVLKSCTGSCISKCLPPDAARLSCLRAELHIQLRRLGLIWQRRRGMKVVAVIYVNCTEPVHRYHLEYWACFLPKMPPSLVALLVWQRPSMPSSWQTSEQHLVHADISSQRQISLLTSLTRSILRQTRSIRCEHKPASPHGACECWAEVS